VALDRDVLLGAKGLIDLDLRFSRTKTILRNRPTTFRAATGNVRLVMEIKVSFRR